MAETRKRNRKPKGTSGRVTAPPSARYTPPTPVTFKQSRQWVPITMGVCLLLGVLIIVLNYLPGAPGIGFLGHLVGLPHDTSNLYMLIGLGFILLGLVFSAKWK